MVVFGRYLRSSRQPSCLVTIDITFQHNPPRSRFRICVLYRREPDSCVSSRVDNNQCYSARNSGKHNSASAYQHVKIGHERVTLQCQCESEIQAQPRTQPRHDWPKLYPNPPINPTRLSLFPTFHHPQLSKTLSLLQNHSTTTTRKPRRPKGLLLSTCLTLLGSLAPPSQSSPPILTCLPTLIPPTMQPQLEAIVGHRTTSVLQQ